MIESKVFDKKVWQHLNLNIMNITLKGSRNGKKRRSKPLLLQSSRWNSEDDPLRPSKNMI